MQISSTPNSHKILTNIIINKTIAKTTAVRLKREQIQLVVDGDVVGTGVAARKGLLQGHLLEKSD